MYLCPQANALSKFGNQLPGPPHLLQVSQPSLWSPVPPVHLMGLPAGTFALQLSTSETLCGHL